MEGWPKYDILLPTGGPNCAPINPISRPTSQGVSPRDVFVRGGQHPAPSAFLASGARRVDSRGFRMLDGEGNLETPLERPQFEVWSIEGR